MKNIDSIPPKIHWRNGFASRHKYQSIQVETQLESLNEVTRTKIANLSSKYFSRLIQIVSNSDNFPPPIINYYKTFYNALTNEFFENFYVLPYENFSGSNYEKGNQLINLVKSTINDDEWYNVFDLIEFWISSENKLMENDIDYIFDEPLIVKLNNIFEQELVGYRIIDSIITPITDDIEIEAIEDISNNPYEDVRKHTQKALDKLSDTKDPDYQNSIKESISFVETMTKILTGKKNSSLSAALNYFEEQNIYIPKQLKEGITKLYNYASTEPGIRHGGESSEETSPAEEDAKLILVICSAFNNYLLTKDSKKT